MKTKFYFIRHGETERNTRAALPEISVNDALNKKGLLQAREAASKLVTKIDYIINSPYARAVQTGEAIANKHKYAVVLGSDSRITEVNFGDLGGKTLAEVEELYPSMGYVEKYVAQEYDFNQVNGESFNDVHNRVYDFISEVEQKYPGKNIVVVTHAGVIRMLYKSTQDIILDHLVNASIHEFEF